MVLSETEISVLKKHANDVRISIIDMLVAAKSGHTAGPLDMADIFTALYFKILRHDPKNPTWSDRDRLILSNGHIAPVLYATLAHAGYFPVAELLTLRKFHSRLQGHPHREYLSALETSSGPLGSGLSQTVGMALADRINGGSKFFYCLTGDGELDCGQNWEAIMQAGKEKLEQMIVIVDRNNIQIDGFTEDIMPLEPLRKKWEAFNWHVFEMDGHNMQEIIETITLAQHASGKPKVILAKTIASKGVPEWEGKYEWHGKPPSTEEAVVAYRALGKK